MFARRTLVLGTLTLAGLSADTASAQTPTPVETTYSVPLAMPATVVSQSTPVVTDTTRSRGIRGRRATRNTITPASFTTPTTATPVTAPPMTLAQSTIPMPMPSTTPTPNVTTAAPAGTTTATPTVVPMDPTYVHPTVPVMVTEGTSTVTATPAAPARRGLFSRIFRR